MLEGVSGEGRQGLHLADCGQPDRYSRADPQPPGLDRERDLRRPQQREGDRCEKLVPAGVEELLQPRKPANLRGRGQAVGLQLLTVAGEQRCNEALPLEAREDGGEQLEIAARAVGRTQRPLHPGAHRPCPGARNGDGRDERPRAGAESPCGGSDDVQSGEHAGDRQREARQRGRRRRAPAGERGRIYSGSHVLAGESEILAQVEGRAQLRHGRLSGSRLFGRSGSAQPVGERPLARSGPGGAQELVQRAAAEEVEIGRIRMRLVEEAGAIVSRPGPAILQAGDAGLVERDGPLGQATAPRDAVVNDHGDQERSDRDEKPGRRDPAGAQRRPPEHETGRRQPSADPGEGVVDPAASAREPLAEREPALELGPGRRLRPGTLSQFGARGGGRGHRQARRQQEERCDHRRALHRHLLRLARSALAGDATIQQPSVRARLSRASSIAEHLLASRPEDRWEG